MIPEFRKLTGEEIELMHKAPILVCILIAGADDKIDRSEIRRAIELTSEKLRSTKSKLTLFYDEVAEDFEDKLKIVIQELPRKEKDRAKIIIGQLTRLNEVFKNSSKEFNIHFYNSLKEIASEIATSSGGMLGMNKVDDMEAKYLSLEMIKDPSIS